MATGGVVAGDGHITWVFLGCQRSPLQGAGTTSLFLFQERRGYHRDRTGEGIRHAAGQSDCCAEGWGTGSLRVRPAGAAPSTPAPRGTRGPRVAEGGSAPSRGSGSFLSPSSTIQNPTGWSAPKATATKHPVRCQQHRFVPAVRPSASV